jgi:hypothetical protein
MNPFETMVAQYNSSLPTITDGEAENLQLTAKGVLIVTPKDSDGTQVIVKNGDSVAGSADRGFIAYGINPSTVASALKTDANGNLLVNVVTGTINIDFTPGIDFDTGTDSAGANPEKGVLGGITGTYQTLVKIQVNSGSSLAIAEWDATCDSEGQFQLVVGDSASGVTKYIRTMLIPESVGFNTMDFGRPVEVASVNTDTYVKIIGKKLRGYGAAMNAAGGINCYVQP